MMQLRRVPWYSSLEWLSVQEAVISADVKLQQLAVARISLWELKSPRVPVAVSTSKMILEAILHDREGHRSRSELQMLHGMAIVRFVNSFVDLEQKKEYARSIGSVAQGLGIPSEIIDCRHRITHQEMPSLEYLRHNTALCLDYLITNYWRPQALVIRNRISSVEFSKQLASGFTAFLQDVELLAPPTNLETSLNKMVKELKPAAAPPSQTIGGSVLWQNTKTGTNMSTTSSNSSTVSSEDVLFAAADATGLKQKEIVRLLKRLGYPEFFGQPAFSQAMQWCKDLWVTLPRSMEFLDSLLVHCANEELLLSFTKDLLLAVYDPQVNAPVLLSAVWILSRVSPNLVEKLILGVLRVILGDCGYFSEQLTPVVNDNLSGVLTSSVAATHFQPLQSATHGKSQMECREGDSRDFGDNLQSDADPTTTERQSTGVHRRVVTNGANCCFDPNTLAQWLSALDVPIEEEQRLLSELRNPGVLALRLLGWLRCLLLLPAAPHSLGGTTGRKGVPCKLPDSLELLLHLFLNPLALTRNGGTTTGVSQAALLVATSLPSRKSPAVSGAVNGTAVGIGTNRDSLLNCKPIYTISSLLSSSQLRMDVFCQKVIRAIHVTHARVQAALRAGLPLIARCAFEIALQPSGVETRTLASNSHTICREILSEVLQLLQEGELRVPHGAASRLSDWVETRLRPRHPPQARQPVPATREVAPLWLSESSGNGAQIIGTGSSIGGSNLGSTGKTAATVATAFGWVRADSSTECGSGLPEAGIIADTDRVAASPLDDPHQPPIMEQLAQLVEELQRAVNCKEGSGGALELPRQHSVQSQQYLQDSERCPSGVQELDPLELPWRDPGTHLGQEMFFLAAPNVEDGSTKIRADPIRAQQLLRSHNPNEIQMMPHGTAEPPGRSLSLTPGLTARQVSMLSGLIPQQSTLQPHDSVASDSGPAKVLQCVMSDLASTALTGQFVAGCSPAPSSSAESCITHGHNHASNDPIEARHFSTRHGIKRQLELSSHGQQIQSGSLRALRLPSWKKMKH